MAGSLFRWLSRGACDFVSDYRNAPEEIWILRVNPQQWPYLPTTNGEIQDRENELIGNLSLHKDLDSILKVNKWRVRLTEKNKDFVFEEFGQNDVIVRTIKMSKDLVDELSLASKFDRGPTCMHKLRDDGYKFATTWLAAWPDVPSIRPTPGTPVCPIFQDETFACGTTLTQLMA